MTAERVCSVMSLEPSEIWKVRKIRRRVGARSLLCFWAVRELGISMTELSRRLNLSLSGVSQSVTRGEKIAEIHGYKLLKKKLYPLVVTITLGILGTLAHFRHFSGLSGLGLGKK